MKRKELKRIMLLPTNNRRIPGTPFLLHKKKEEHSPRYQTSREKSFNKNLQNGFRERHHIQRKKSKDLFILLINDSLDIYYKLFE